MRKAPYLSCFGCNAAMVEENFLRTQDLIIASDKLGKLSASLLGASDGRMQRQILS